MVPKAQACHRSQNMFSYRQMVKSSTSSYVYYVQPGNRLQMNANTYSTQQTHQEMDGHIVSVDQIIWYCLNHFQKVIIFIRLVSYRGMAIAAY